ncbi:hypothetical protein PACTADRAFT_38220 [Pachysolen tannophilus NRRL Y-2460]|uniref:Palmitoyltransferase n=1 Tax=Pachysolen tannophilus NRRL Y-2460 TaxID=669874 RepID=A0A1E4U3A2_PACTA|nr:hypothetical protein PACTADRAFT_38220 [Pachysolen tannophilus NRRL Y-2460]
MAVLYKVEKCCCTLASTFPKAFCSSLYVWSGYVLAIDIPLKCLQGYSAFLVFIIALYFAVIGLYSYYMVVLVGGGSPLDFQELRLVDGTPEENEAVVPPSFLLNKSLTVRNDGSFRYCNKCRVWKPDRCHHCSSCQKCVLKMDHHCPWFATCIGFKNVKYFIQFLIYSVLYSSFGLIVTGELAYKFFTNEEYLENYFSLNYLFLFILSLTIFISVGVFAGFTVYQVLKNQTTIESYDFQRYRTNFTKKTRSNVPYPEVPNSDEMGNIFDLGWKKNLQTVMGTTWREWLLPIQVRDNGNNLDITYAQGLNFEVNEDIYHKLQQNSKIQNQLYEELMTYRRQRKQQQQEYMNAYNESENTETGVAGGLLV